MIIISEKTSKLFTLKNILTTGTALRIFLILYSKIHDHLFQLKYTDKDYFVFTDASQHVANGNSPFLRTTYRYTPALAWLLIPTTIFPIFGKLVFAFTDIFLAWILYKIASHKHLWTDNEERNFLIFLCIGWVFNPLSFIISSRGNADAIVCLAVMLTLYFLQTDRWILSAICLGAFAIHVKIYPIIYLPSIYLYICRKTKGPFSIWDFSDWGLNVKGFAYVTFTLSLFTGTIFFWYNFYGQLFLKEYLLYHITRVDTTHNFSPYYLSLYQSMNLPETSKLVGLFAFIPQVFCIALFGLKFHNDLPFCWLLTTISFVALNKVCTSQYFLWYICFIPLISSSVYMSKTKAGILFVLWLVGQGLWMLPAYFFEFQGYNTHIYMWLASLIFLSINFYVMGSLMKGYKDMNALKKDL